ncbi:MAG TPA: cation diffusion facilitator family transporter [Alkalispirochaeta sp.]|nr:cation diffusion facilitator family transporter [Alkalispirochaeta sp.]
MTLDDAAAKDRGRRIVIASWIGIIGNGILAALKTVAGFLSGSAAVLGDGIDSGLDVLTSGITLVAARITSKPPDIDHPYGHSRVETIATKSVSFIIFFAGAQLAFGTLGDLVAGTARALPSELAVWVTVVSIIGKSVLAIHKGFVGKRVNSSMLIADAKNMRADIVISVGVLVGLGFTILFNRPVVDSIVALLISLWIMFVAFRIFLETNMELMEGHKDRATYEEIFSAVEGVPGAEHPHRARVRTIGSMHIIDLDIEVDGNLTVTEAHGIAQRTEQAIKQAVGNVYDVLVHVEPVGNVESRERFGVSQQKLHREVERGRRSEPD